MVKKDGGFICKCRLTKRRENRESLQLSHCNKFVATKSMQTDIFKGRRRMQNKRINDKTMQNKAILNIKITLNVNR